MIARCVATMLCLLPVAAHADVEGQIDQLLEWQESPLDLRDASATELVLLPGIDPDLAEAIVGLRRLGRLTAVDDLRAVPGLTEPEIDALRPYVRVGNERVAARVAVSSTAQHRDAVGARAVHRLLLGNPVAEVSAVVVDDGQSLGRTALRVDAAGLTFLAGHLRVGAASGFFDPAPGRSRVAPAARPRPPRIRARTDSAADTGWTAIAVAHPVGQLFAARGADQEPVAGASFALSGRGLELQAAVRGEETGWAGSVDFLRGRHGWIGLTADGGQRAARAGLRLAGRFWRAGVDASTSDGPLRAGSDPVSGHRLDREHRAVQMHGRVRGTGWSAAALWRELVRGSAPPVSTVEFEAVWRAMPGSLLESLSARVRAAPRRRISLTATRRDARGELRLRFAREEGAAGGSELLGLERRWASARQELRLAAVGVDGSSSRVWMLARPGTGIYPVWVRPPGALLGAGWGLRGGSARIGAWFWVRADAGRPPAPGFGLFCSIEAARMVQRLQGSGPSGTGAPTRRPRSAPPESPAP